MERYCLNNNGTLFRYWREILQVLIVGLYSGVIFRIGLKQSPWNATYAGYLFDAALCAAATAIIVSYLFNFLLFEALCTS